MTRPENFMNIAHRGASSYAPENTFAAYDKALAMGVDHVELDVHYTSDGHIVVIHDDQVDRTTNGSGRVSDHTLAQLRSLDAGSWFGLQDTGERIRSLGEVLEHYKGRLYIHLEVKARAEGLAEPRGGYRARLRHGRQRHGRVVLEARVGGDTRLRP